MGRERYTNREAWLICLVLVISSSGCGTVTPIPAQGGGKRFAVEQALISASARKALSEIPIDSVVGKGVALEVSVIQDEGGGAFTIGGRPYAAGILAAQYNRLRSYTSNDVSNTTSSSAGFQNIQSEPAYYKDITYNGSDARQFNNLLTSLLLRNNVKINPNPVINGGPDYMLEVLVDVFGIWRSRTDWLAYNAESLMATTSIEYVLTPLKDKKAKRLVGRLGYDATYRESYVAWMGPVETSIEVTPSNFSQIIGTFGDGNGGYSNLAIEEVKPFVKPEKPAPIILNPTDELLRRTR